MWSVKWNEWKFGFAFYRGGAVKKRSACDGSCDEPSQYHFFLGPFDYFGLSGRFLKEAECRCEYGIDF